MDGTVANKHSCDVYCWLVFQLRWFGSSGIRGIAFEEFTLDLAIKIGLATGAKYGNTVIGRDTRVTGQLFSAAVSGALMSVGADVCDVGIVTTPTLAYAARKRDCGVMITASHNPPEYNGIKLWNPDGSSFGTEQMNDIESRMVEEIPPADWKEVGSLSEYKEATSDHLKRILSLVGKANIKVVVDCANGPASLITPFVLENMGCEVITLNSQLNGRFPGRPAEPTQENLSDLQRSVVKHGADLGIAHDGDADRMVAIDDRGRYVGGDLLLKLFAQEMEAKSIVVPVDATMLLDDRFGERIYRTRVGDVYISEKIKEEGADFGGEPSGTWIFPEISLCPDGIFAAAKLVEISAQRKLSEIVDDIPSLPMIKELMTFAPDKRQQILSSLEKHISALSAIEVDTTDGFRIQFEDGWALIRLSGTEPKLRITVETRKQERAVEIMSRMKEIARSCLA